MTEDSPEIPMVSLGDQLAEMIVPLRQALEQGEANAAYLEGRWKAQKFENQKMKRALDVLDPDSKPKKEKRTGTSHIGRTRSNGTATGYGISVEATGPVVARIKEVAEANGGFVTQPDIHRPMDLDQAKCSSAFKYLREIGFIGKAGRDKTGRRELWRILDADAFDKALNAAKEQIANG